TPPCVLIRQQRSQTVTLALLEQGRKTTRTEVRVRKPDVQSFRMGEMPGAAATGGSIARQDSTHTQLNQHGPAAALRFPLPPQRSTKAQQNQASQIDQ